MPATFVVSVPETFTQVILLSVEPRKAFQSEEQERTKDGTPKWSCQLVAGFRRFDRQDNEILTVTVASETNPADNAPLLSPVEIRGLEVGVIEKKNRDGEMVSAGVWYRASEIRSLTATGRGSKLEPVAS